VSRLLADLKVAGACPLGGPIGSPCDGSNARTLGSLARHLPMHLSLISLVTSSPALYQGVQS
jgi:hypothetical protein